MLMTNLKIVAVVVGTLALYTLIATSIPQVQSEVPEELTFGGEVSTAELVAAGEELFQGAGGCTACHGTGTRAPNLLTDHEGEGLIGQRCDGRVPGQDCKTYLWESLVNPTDHVVEGFDPMVFQPSTFSAAQLWAMVSFLQDQGGEVTVTGEDIAAAEADEGTGDAAAGEVGAGGGAVAGAEAAPGETDPVALLEDNLCLNCHTMDDRGIELGPSFNGIGSRRTADEIRAAILDPNAEASEGYEDMVGVMPTNFGQVFSAGQLELLVQYLAGRS